MKDFCFLKKQKPTKSRFLLKASLVSVFQNQSCCYHCSSCNGEIFLCFGFQKQKSAGYYRNRCSELDAKLLNIVPDCPRTAKPTFLSNFDWALLTAATPIEELIKKPETIFGNTTEKEHAKPPTEKLKAESIEKDLNENKEQAVKEEVNNNNNNNNNRAPAKRLNIKKHIKEIKQNSERERSPSPQKMRSLENDERNSPQKFNLSPKKDTRSPSPQKLNGHPVIDKHKSFEVLEIVDNPRKSTEPQKRSISRQATHENEEVNSKRAASRQDTHNFGRESPRKLQNGNSEEMQNFERESPRKHRSGSSQEMHNFERESPRKLRNGSSHRYLESPATGSEGVIEGIVDGVNEVETLNEQGQDVSDENENVREKDAEISAMVEAGNMEQLAAVVLNGEGDRLVGQQSDNVELQSFLDNVPVYMVQRSRKTCSLLLSQVIFYIYSQKSTGSTWLQRMVVCETCKQLLIAANSP